MNGYDFLDSKQGHRLMVSCDCPPPGIALIVRKHGDAYYWVPIEFRDDFRLLSLKTTAMRGEPVSAPEYWDATVQGALQVVTGDPIVIGGVQVGTAYDVTIAVEPKLPKDHGSIKSLAVGGRVVDLVVSPSSVDGLSIGQQTNVLTLSYIHDQRSPNLITANDTKNGHLPLAPTDFTKALAGQKAKIFLDSYHPPVQKTSDLVKSIDNELRILRLNSNPPPH